MDKNKKTTSSLFGGAGILMIISGILMAASGRVAIGALFWASASCMFPAARHFAIAAEKTETEEQSRTGQFSGEHPQK